MAGDSFITFDWLVGIGVSAHGNDVASVARVAKFRLQQSCRFRLEKQLGFEIKSWRQSKIGVRWTCETVNATVFTTAIRVD